MMKKDANRSGKEGLAPLARLYFDISCDRETQRTPPPRAHETPRRTLQRSPFVPGTNDWSLSGTGPRRWLLLIAGWKRKQPEAAKSERHPEKKEKEAEPVHPPAEEG